MTKDEYLIALDIASCTGFAIGRPGGIPRLGSIRLGDDGATPAERGAKLITWLGETVSTLRPRWLVYESPLPGKRKDEKSTLQTGFMLMGLAFTAGAVASLFGCHSISQGHAGSVRKHFLGRGNFPSAQAKRLAFRRCQELGWDPKGSLDAADAGALWHWKSCQLDSSIPLLPPMPEAKGAA